MQPAGSSHRTQPDTPTANVRCYPASTDSAHRVTSGLLEFQQRDRCELITATLRDVYLVESRAGRHILIVYRHNQRTWDEIAAEWQFVDYLAQQNVPVAPALATTTGEQILTLQAPEGIRYAVVTTYVSGQHLRRRPSMEATRRCGKAIEQHVTHVAILQAMPAPRLFAALWDGDQAVACAVGVVYARALSLVDVVTSPQHRQQGYATALLCQIFAWAQQMGASDASL
jgi:GNAT superfamily N-acetyltransferase